MDHEPDATAEQRCHKLKKKSRSVEDAGYYRLREAEGKHGVDVDTPLTPPNELKLLVQNEELAVLEVDQKLVDTVSNTSSSIKRPDSQNDKVSPYTYTRYESQSCFYRKTFQAS